MFTESEKQTAIAGMMEVLDLADHLDLIADVVERTPADQATQVLWIDLQKQMCDLHTVAEFLRKSTQVGASVIDNDDLLAHMTASLPAL